MNDIPARLAVLDPLAVLFLVGGSAMLWMIWHALPDDLDFADLRRGSPPRGAVASAHPASTGDFHAWFWTDAECLDYLEWLRWPDGFVCPECGHGAGWRMDGGRWCCMICASRTSVTAGTIFDRTRATLTYGPVTDLSYRSREPLSEGTRRETLEYHADFCERVGTPERAVHDGFRDRGRLP
jgi:hypothetical protein